jgi:antitoxin (DNA-binding transcriptional repressor) of toxin-antitoxin stability system
MARRIGIRELRDTLTATIRRVRAGETFEVTHDGVPVAVLAPFPTDRVERLVAAGDVHAPRPLDRPIRLYPVETGVSASEALEEDRAGR